MSIKHLPYSFFTTNEIKPTGWLKKQLEIQAAGLSGNLDKVWPDVRDSAWVGGNREGWERVPYWLDGFIPLAYLLEDEDMIARAARYMNVIMDTQCEDGWICPCKPEERGHYDLWAALLMGKVLTVYADCAGEHTPEGRRAVKTLSRMLCHLNGFLNGTTLRNWGACRWFEGVIPALWLYERTEEDWLIELCLKLRVQGVNWAQVVDSGLWEMRTTGWDYLTHVVNVGMMLKSEALMSRITEEDPNAFARRAKDALLAHRIACHHFSGDECLAGTSPIHGSELCSVVEAMYSYEHLFAITGDTYWLDELETAAFNALPATVSPDMWTHQYDQLSNQIACVPIDHTILRANGPESVMFGLEPNYGCCTANFNQGFPKFALSTFMKTEDGIASCALAPARLTTQIGDAHVTCELDTEYPFRNRLTYHIKTDRPVCFTFYLRVPACAASATFSGVSLPVMRGHMMPIRRLWEGEHTMTMELSFEPHYEARPDGLLTLWHGPLLYALSIGEKWERVEYERDGVPRTFPYCDYHITPTTDWNYGFAGEASESTLHEADYDRPFDPNKPPLYLEVPMAKIPWQEEHGHCLKLPDSSKAMGNAEMKRLIPYGCTNLRITETYRVSSVFEKE